MKMLWALPLLLALSACSTPAPEPTPSFSSQDVYLETVRDTNALVGASDDELVNPGQDACGLLKSGTDFDKVTELLQTGGIDDPADAEIIVAAGIDAFCPEVDGG